MKVFGHLLLGITLLDATHTLQQLRVPHPYERSSKRSCGLDGTEAEHGSISLWMAGVIESCEGLRTIFNHQQTVPLGYCDQWIHGHAAAKKMSYHDRACLRRDG